MSQLSVSFPENRMTWGNTLSVSCHLDGVPFTDHNHDGPAYYTAVATQCADTLAWLSENKWSCSFYTLLFDRNVYGYKFVTGEPSIDDLAYGFTNDPLYGSVTTPSLECCLDAEVPVWLVIEMDLSYDRFTPSSTISDYETLLGPRIDHIEDNPAFDAVVGYSWEAGYNVAPQWLRGHLDDIGSKRLIGQQWTGTLFMMSTPTVPAPNPTWTIPPRLQYLDYVIWDFFDTDQMNVLNKAPWTLAYIKENYPDIKWGVQAVTDSELNPGTWYWNQGHGPMPTLAEKQLMMYNSLFRLKWLLGACDIVDVGVENIVGIYGETINYIEQCEQVDALHLSEPFNPNEIEELTATTSTNQNITVPIGWNV